jgi:tripartite-type tricarboxylate transporter receptor subunit TctC
MSTRELSSGWFFLLLSALDVIRYLMFFTDNRYNDPPDVPTAAELDYPEAILPTYVGLYVHKNTPDEIRKILAEVCRKT